jgi:hypothetical protein
MERWEYMPSEKSRARAVARSRKPGENGERHESFL